MESDGRPISVVKGRVAGQSHVHSIVRGSSSVEELKSAMEPAKAAVMRKGRSQRGTMKLLMRTKGGGGGGGRKKSARLGRRGSVEGAARRRSVEGAPAPALSRAQRGALSDADLREALDARGVAHAHARDRAALEALLRATAGHNREGSDAHARASARAHRSRAGSVEIALRQMQREHAYQEAKSAEAAAAQVALAEAAARAGRRRSRVVPEGLSEDRDDDGDGNDGNAPPAPDARPPPPAEPHPQDVAAQFAADLRAIVAACDHATASTNSLLAELAEKRGAAAVKPHKKALRRLVKQLVAEAFAAEEAAEEAAAAGGSGGGAGAGARSLDHASSMEYGGVNPLASPTTRDASASDASRASSGAEGGGEGGGGGEGEAASPRGRRLTSNKAFHLGKVGSGKGLDERMKGRSREHSRAVAGDGKRSLRKLGRAMGHKKESFEDQWTGPGGLREQRQHASADRGFDKLAKAQDTLRRLEGWQARATDDEGRAHAGRPLEDLVAEFRRDGGLAGPASGDGDAASACLARRAFARLSAFARAATERRWSSSARSEGDLDAALAFPQYRVPDAALRRAVAGGRLPAGASFAVSVSLAEVVASGANAQGGGGAALPAARPSPRARRNTKRRSFVGGLFAGGASDTLRTYQGSALSSLTLLAAGARTASCAGWMRKKAGSERFLGDDYQRRYFVLRGQPVERSPNTLEY